MNYHKNYCHGEGNGNPFQYSCLENPMDRGAWQGVSRVHGVSRVKHDLAINSALNDLGGHFLPPKEIKSTLKHKGLEKY